MPSADRYTRYRADQTTIWVSKTAADYLSREREPGESSAGALDRMINEVRRTRRASGVPERPAVKSAGKTATKSAGKTATKGGAKTGTRSAAKGGAKTATKRAAKSGARGAAAR